MVVVVIIGAPGCGTLVLTQLERTAMEIKRKGKIAIARSRFMNPPKYSPTRGA
jgi:hypothetical protein